MRFVTLLILLVGMQPLWAQTQRLALVIGNADYESETPLVNTLNDARDVAAKLESIGFRVTRVENAGRRTLSRQVNDFVRQVQGGDAVALVYYSGHGMQVDGHNYLIPVDAQVTDALDVPSEGLSVDRILAGLGNRGDDAVNLVILDACRNNPFKKSGSKSIGDKGLARVSAPSGTLILYATKPGETASDNPDGRNGLFTKYLLQAMSQPGVQVEESFKQVARNVYTDSRRLQSPWQEGVIYGRFYFVPPSAPGPPPAPVPGPPPPASPDAVEAVFWQSVERSPSAAGYRAYLDQYPNGRFAALARLRLRAVEASAVPVGRITQLLALCQAHLSANRLTTGAGGNALDCYRQVLEKDPGNADALEGMEAIVDRYLEWAEAGLEQRRYDTVRRYLDRARTVSADDPRITALEARIKASRETADAEVRRPGPGVRQPQEGAGRGDWTDPVTGMEFTQVPGGCYRMGNDAEDDDEKPAHQVCLGDFWMGRDKVTQRQWSRLMGSSPPRSNPSQDSPVVRVSWGEVQEFIRRLNAETGQRYRLPTEAEWEYACRGGARGEQCSSGDAASWSAMGMRRPSALPVDRGIANSLGLYGLCGDVWEWVHDVYDPRGYRRHARDNPVILDGGADRVTRGGQGGYDFEWPASCTNRAASPHHDRQDFLGFRLLKQ